MQNSMNTKLSAGNLVGCRYRDTCRNGQNGALLLVLIVSLVVLSLLSGALVYIFSSSTLNPVSGNYAQRAYYNAEAGFRYVAALYRNSSMDETLLVDRTIYPLPGGGKAVVTVNLPTFTPATAQVTGDSSCSNSGCSIPFSSVAGGGTFPSASRSSPVFFFKSGSEIPYRYTGNSGAILSGIYPAFSFKAGDEIKTIKSATITSTGTFGGGNIWDLWNVSRTVTYAWPLSSSSSGTVINKDTTANTFDVTKWNIAGRGNNGENNAAIQHIADTGGLMFAAPLFDNLGVFKWENNAIHIGAIANFILPYDGYDFTAARTASGNTISYDVQAKIDVGGGYFTINNYLIGLSTRLLTHLSGINWRDDQFGISYAKGNNSHFNLPTLYDPYIVFWRSEDDVFKLIAYKKLTVADGVVTAKTFTDDMSTTPNGWSVSRIRSNCETCGWTDNEATDRGKSRRGHLTWVLGDSIFASQYPSISLYRYFDFTPGVTSATISFWYKLGPTGNWSTLFSGVTVNDINVPLLGHAFYPTQTWQQWTETVTDILGYKLTSNSKISINIQASTGTTADVYIDDFQITETPILIDWSTLGVRMREITSPSLHNEIEVFFGNPVGNIGIGPNTYPYDDNRAPNPLIVGAVTTQNDVFWPPFSPINYLPTSSDKFTLVSSYSADTNASANPWKWQNNNPAADGSFTDIWGCTYNLKTGGALEPKAVITTSSTGAITSSNNCRTTDVYYGTPDNRLSYIKSEVGIHVFSNATYDSWFDDFSIQVIQGEGGRPYIPPVEQ